MTKIQKQKAALNKLYGATASIAKSLAAKKIDDEDVALTIIKSRSDNNRIIGNMKILYDYECGDCNKVNTVIDELEVNYHQTFDINELIHNPKPRLVRGEGKAYISSPHTCKYCGLVNHNRFEQVKG